MAKNPDTQRLEVDRANKESIAEELSKSPDPSNQREADRQSQQAQGLSDEIASRDESESEAGGKSADTPKE